MEVRRHSFVSKVSNQARKVLGTNETVEDISHLLIR